METIAVRGHAVVGFSLPSVTCPDLAGIDQNRQVGGVISRMSELADMKQFIGDIHRAPVTNRLVLL